MEGWGSARADPPPPVGQEAAPDQSRNPNRLEEEEGVARRQSGVDTDLVVRY